MLGVATIATSLAVGCLVFTGCGAGVQAGLGRAAPRSAETVARPTAGNPPHAKTNRPRTGANRRSGSVSELSEGEWLARGVVEVARGGGALRSGDVIYRPWLFQRQCSHAHCAVYWTRRIDIGVFTAQVSFPRAISFKASFKNESAPCESLTGREVADVGLLTSDFSATLSAGTDRIDATEHTYATTPACGAVEHLIRWTATRLTRAATSSVRSSAL